MGRLSYLRSLLPAAACDRAVLALPLEVDEDGLPARVRRSRRKQLVEISR